MENIQQFYEIYLHAKICAILKFLESKLLVIGLNASDKHMKQLLIGASCSTACLIVAASYRVIENHQKAARKEKDKVRVNAIGINSYGGLESICLVDNYISVPVIQRSDDVLIQVKAAAIDQVDFNIAEGYGGKIRKHLTWQKQSDEFPVILGRDCAGIVIATGSEVSEFQPGDEVWAVSSPYHPGVMSQLVSVSKENVGHMPHNLTFEGAAVLPFSAIVTWNALVHQAKLQPNSIKGKRILVHDGSSEVGILAIQLLKSWGGHITTTVRQSAISSVIECRVNDIIVNDIEDFMEELRKRAKFDVIFNTIGSVLHDWCNDACTPNGIVISIVKGRPVTDQFGVLPGVIYASFLHLKNLLTQIIVGNKQSWSNFEVTSTSLEEIKRLIEEDQIAPLIDSIWEFEDHRNALQHAFNDTLLGKVVIKME